MTLIEHSDASATASVRDDDGTDLLTLALTPATQTVNEGGVTRHTLTATTVADDTFTEAKDLVRVFGFGYLPVVVSSAVHGQRRRCGVNDQDFEDGKRNAIVEFREDRFAATGSGTARGLVHASPAPAFAVYMPIRSRTLARPSSWGSTVLQGRSDVDLGGRRRGPARSRSPSARDRWWR